MQWAACPCPPQEQAAGIRLFIRIVINLLGGGNGFSNFLFANTTQWLVPHFTTSMLAKQNAVEFDAVRRSSADGIAHFLTKSSPTTVDSTARPGASSAMRHPSFYREQSFQTIGAHAVLRFFPFPVLAPRPIWRELQRCPSGGLLWAALA